MIKLPASSNIPKNVFGLLKALMENFCKAYIKTGLGTCQLQLSLFEQAEEDGLQTQKKDLGMYQDTTSRIEISNLNNRVRMAALDATLDWDVRYEELPNRSWIELSKGSKLAAALQSYRPGQIVLTAITGVLTTTAFARIALIGLGQTVIVIWKRLWRDPIRPEQPKSLSVGQNLEKLQRMADLRTIEPTSRHKWMDFSVVRAS
ncbi:hypothetical protein BY996DRAFT_6470857 [Phakopsora pachyrhizi]|nr:hypothetical protein BY996DRAFT_6470857 [Phakopsora pachyrhizi]